MFGYSQFIRFGYIACVFYISTLFGQKYPSSPKDSYIAIYVLFMSVMGSGMTISAVPSLGRAKDSASKVFGIIDDKSTIDVRNTKGKAVVEEGEIEFCDVDFKYPSRDSRVLRRIKMKIPATKKIALVGHSGCGKSTIANLLLRFYDVTEGCLKIDGVDIRDYNIHLLRK